MKVTFSVILSKQFNPLLFIPYASIVGDEWRMDNTSFAYVSDVRCIYKHKPQRLKQSFYMNITAAAAQSVGALALIAEDRVFESQPRQTLVVKKGSDSSIAKRSLIGVSVTGPRR